MDTAVVQYNEPLAKLHVIAVATVRATLQVTRSDTPLNHTALHAQFA